MADRPPRGKAGDLAQLEKELAGAPRPSYCFHGANRFFLSEAKRRLRQRLAAAAGGDLGVKEIELGGLSDWAEADTALRSADFFGGSTLVMLETEDNLKKEVAAALCAYLEETPGNNPLCLLAPSLKKITAARNRIKKQGGLERQFDLLPEAELRRWASARCKDLELRVKPELLRQLVGSLPPDPGDIESELQKLLTVLGPGGELREAELHRLVGDQRDEDVWRLAASMAPGEERETLRSLERLLADGGRDAVGIIGPLSYTLTMLLRARLLLDEGQSPAQAARQLPLGQYRAREYVDRAAALSRRLLLVWLSNLQTLDLSLRRGEQDLRPARFESALVDSLGGRLLPR